MNDEQRWQVFLARDVAYDGQFVVAVRTTGIYCRPSCPARRPRRENTVFYPAPVEAEGAGYRPCRRCHPEQVGSASVQTAWVAQACRLIEAAADQPPSLTELADQLGLSVHHVQRVFKRVMGISPRQYSEAYRLGRVKASLKQEETVSMAMYEAGYGSSSRFYENGASRLGMAPTIYRRGGAGTQIRYTLVDSPLGRLMVAATERGVCFVSLGDSDETLDRALRGDYHAADLIRDDEGLGETVQVILSFLAGTRPQLNLPLDIQGTAFQWRVWEALRTIPYGETRTYAQLAQAIDEPKAARAVGHACATNPVSLVIPCHRAVRTDGSLGGYRWGLSRKEALLAQEKAHASDR
ncbi:MAG: bifunctional DNA-binding transcriptional regulator/O6-methylguanine-DNA methyltransferase Ada [Anaerolineae bacterium]|nr:bifunctional DNA-binding transcriptional regulator/O6-methylguanine-DNA methyltransferase Ada [Anaerolineae bacterium]